MLRHVRVTIVTVKQQ